MNRECIEIEHSDDYRRGYEDGIEAGRVIAVKMVEDERSKQLSYLSCNGCKHFMICPGGEVEDCSSDERCLRYFSGVIGCDDCYEEE